MINSPYLDGTIRVTCNGLYNSHVSLSYLLGGELQTVAPRTLSGPNDNLDFVVSPYATQVLITVSIVGALDKNQLMPGLLEAWGSSHTNYIRDFSAYLSGSVNTGDMEIYPGLNGPKGTKLTKTVDSDWDIFSTATG